MSKSRISYKDGVLRYTPTKADLTRDQEEREKLWREETHPVYASESGFEAWAMTDLRFRPEPKWLIDYVVEEEGLTVFFAGDKTGKTAVLSSILWSWVAGRQEFFLDETFQFRDPTDEAPRRVLYVLLEGTGTYYRRFDAWRKRFADEHEEVEGFVVTTSPVQLWDGKMNISDADTWPQSLQDLADAIKSIEPQIIVIDTFARATPGVDENSSQLGAVVGALDQIRNAFGIATVLVHHTPVDPKMKRPRGWSGLKAAASSYVYIEGDQDERVKRFITGPHRNADFTKPVPFVTRPFADAFVVEVPTPMDHIKNDGQMKILEYLQANPGWHERQVLDFGAAATTTNDRLIALMEMDAVEREKVGTSYRWRAKDQAEEL